VELMSFRPDQVRRYFEARLQGQRLSHRQELMVHCLFHDDRNPSLSINMEKGLWRCHAGCGEGGILDFEEKFSNCDRQTAKATVAELMGEKQLFSRAQKPEAIYPYHDAQGRVVFEKVRYPGKRFLQRRPTDKGGYDYKLGDLKKPLYRLPGLLVANEIFVCEGEKDADNVLAAFAKEKLPESVRIAATTNFDGAGKWKEHYGPFFAGKKVVIFPDQDEIGRKHAEQVAASLFPFACGIKVVNLPGLPDKGDVSDFLEHHSAADLVAEIKKTPQWCPSDSRRKLFVSAATFVSQAPEQVDWLVEGIIERGANGFFSAVPKGGKSWAAVDLAISLALGCNWLGFRVPEAVRVAVISREDNPSLTAWRIRHLSACRRGVNLGLLDTNLYVNSRQQSPELMLDNPEQMTELLADLRSLKPRFAIFDVFNVLHCADENDNQEMRTILRQLSTIQAEIGCGIGVVHHYNKADQGSMTQRLRGSSAIAGWAEWLIGISMADENTKTRRMEFELKAAQPPDPIYFRIDSSAESTKLDPVEAPVTARRREGSAAERYMQ